MKGLDGGGREVPAACPAPILHPSCHKQPVRTSPLCGPRASSISPRAGRVLLGTSGSCSHISFPFESKPTDAGGSGLC